MAGLRQRWGGLQRRLGIYPQSGTDTAVCQGCARPGVEVVTMTPAWGGLAGWSTWRAWHTRCYRPDDRARGVWWLPGPVTVTWREVCRSLPPEPTGCCGCGGDRGPVRYVVWGPDCGPADGEGFCRPCFIEHGPGDWLPGCSWADLGPGVSCVEDQQLRALAAFGSRRPVDAPGGAS